MSIFLLGQLPGQRSAGTSSWNQSEKKSCFGGDVDMVGLVRRDVNAPASAF